MDEKIVAYGLENIQALVSPDPQIVKEVVSVSIVKEGCSAMKNEKIFFLNKFDFIRRK